MSVPGHRWEQGIDENIDQMHRPDASTGCIDRMHRSDASIGASIKDI